MDKSDTGNGSSRNILFEMYRTKMSCTGGRKYPAELLPVMDRYLGEIGETDLKTTSRAYDFALQVVLLSAPRKMLRDEHLDLAMRMLDRWLAIDPLCTHAHIFLGYAQEASGDKGAAPFTSYLNAFLAEKDHLLYLLAAACARQFVDAAAFADLKRELGKMCSKRSRKRSSEFASLTEQSSPNFVYPTHRKVHVERQRLLVQMYALFVEGDEIDRVRKMLDES